MHITIPASRKIAERYTEIELVFFTYIVMVILLTPLVMYYENDVFARIPSFTTADMDRDDPTDCLP